MRVWLCLCWYAFCIFCVCACICVSACVVCVRCVCVGVCIYVCLWEGAYTYSHEYCNVTTSMRVYAMLMDMSMCLDNLVSCMGSFVGVGVCVCVAGERCVCVHYSNGIQPPWICWGLGSLTEWTNNSMCTSSKSSSGL